MRFWRADPDADYGPMNAFSRHHFKLDQPEKCWEDCLRTAGSLKMGTNSLPVAPETTLVTG